MKKKLNLFCVLIFVVIICDVASMSNVFITGFSSGMRDGAERRDITETTPCNYSYITLVPREMTRATAQTVTDKASGKALQAWPTQLIVPTGGRMNVFAAIFKMAYTLAFGVLALAALVSFVCFVRNANRDDIFTRKNIKLLRATGWCLFAAGVIVTADGFYDIHTAKQALSLSGYAVDYGSAADFTNIIFGLFSLVIAEAFAIGLKMKEEQELTI